MRRRPSHRASPTATPPATSEAAASQELATLTALAQALSGPADLATSLEAALSTVADALGLETGWVWLLDGSGEPRLAAARALPPALRDHPDAMHGDCYCLKRFRAGDLRGAANVSVVWCSRLAVLIDEAREADIGNLQCHASVPLAVGERRLGMLNVASPDWRELSDDELSLLTTAGALVSLAVERSRLEAASARAVAAEERNRLAREIHDTLAQGLAALTMQLEVADALAAASSDARVGAAVDRALGLARSALDEARRSVLDLREAPLEGRTLVQALEMLAAETQASSDRPRDVRVVSDAASGAGSLPPAVEVGLFRIAQQALANASRHSRAHSIVVRLTRDSDGIALHVEDDGVGFEPAEVPAHRFGLVGMRERARLVGGTLTVASAPSRGTAIDVVIPLRQTPPQPPPAAR